MFPWVLPEYLTVVLTRRHVGFGAGNMAYGGVFGPFVVIALRRSRPNNALSPPSPVRFERSFRSNPGEVLSAGRVVAVRSHTTQRKVTILLRFRFDGEDHGWSTGRPHPESDPESEPSGLSRHQQIEFLRLVHDGLGRLMVCSQLKVSERALKRTLARTPSFRRALEHVERMQAENLFAILYATALGGDTQAARFLLARHDRQRGS